MDIVETHNGVGKDVVDLYGNPFHATLAEVVEHLSHAPYWHVDEKAPARLIRAAQLLRQSRVQLHDSHRATVYGTTRSYDLDGYACTCPSSQKGPTHWCVHAVTVKLARTLEERMAPNPTLPLPPQTVDERLAQAPRPPEYAATIATQVALGTIHDTTALQTHHTPQEDRMADNEYIPEPDTEDAPVAVLDAPTPAPVTRPLPGPVLLPSLDAQSLKRSMQEWSAQRQVIRSFLQQELKEGVDFYRLQVRGKDANPTLSKAGAEKFLGLFQLQASFAPDLLTWEMLGKPTDHVIYICTLRTRSGEIVGEGRGSRSLKKDSGDTNKAIKMSEKSALIDAVLRTGALSEVYTQDVEDLQDEPAPAKETTPTKPTGQSQDLRKRIWAQVNRHAPHIKTQDDAEAWVQERTGLAMEPDHYSAIAAKLAIPS